MTILPIHNTIMNSVTYVLYSEDVDYCVLIDCGEWDTLQPVLQKLGKRVEAVLLTHGHSDHIYGLVGLIQSLRDKESKSQKDEESKSLKVYTTDYGHQELHNDRKNMSFYHGHPFTVEGYQQQTLQGGETLHFEGLMDVDVIATPGHSPSCLTYKVGKNLFTGDAYIPGLKVFTKFPKSDKQLAEKSIAILSQMESEGYTIYCGHHSY